MTRPVAALSSPSPFGSPTPPVQAGQRSGGRFILSDQIEHRCQTIAITSTGASLRTAVQGRIGETVICYLDQFGRVEGRIARHLDEGFAMEFSAPALKREKLAHQLAWQAERIARGGAEAGRDERIEPTRRRVVLRLPDGRHVATQVINLSRSGAALTCPVTLAVGAAVTLGRRPAVVARATQRLVGLEFATAIDEDEFKTDIVL